MSIAEIQEVFHVVKQRPIQFWTSEDIHDWLKRRRPKLALKYAFCFIRHRITGRVLVEMTEQDLLEIGIYSREERHDIIYEVLREKLHCDYIELKTAEADAE
ncbi:unnamed protein product, partial [Mesorhabditis spiculigera]